MMKIDAIVKRDFPVAGAFVGIADLKKEFVKHPAIVIMEDTQFFGVLTASDIARKQHILAIDCLNVKSQVSLNQSLSQVISMMNFENTEVLPVVENSSILGLVFQKDIVEHLYEHNTKLKLEIDYRTDKFNEQTNVLKEKIFQQRIELETIIEQRTKELLDLVETKDKFIRILAHELRNPFNGILGLLKLLQQNIRVYDIEKIEKFLTQIYHSANVTFELLVDLLDWLNLNNKQFPFNPEEVCICQLLNNEIFTANFIADQKRISIKNIVPESVCAFVDRNMVKTIFRNLINNAIKFTVKEGEIIISAIEYDDVIELSVKDSGIGISREIIDRIFKEGIGATKGTANEIGSGIGLLLCKEFVEIDGGRIWIESSLGEGSIFKFTLPKFKPDVKRRE